MNELKQTETEVIETRTANLWLGRDGILRVINKPNVEVTVEDAFENVETANKLMGERRRPTLVDIKTVLTVEREARKYYAEENLSLAQALIISSPLSKVIGNFFLGLNKASCPMKLFTSEEDAINWLQGYVT